MTRTTLLLTLILGVLPTASRSAEPRKARTRDVKVAVLPFQAVSADVPARTGPRVTARLAAEVHAAAGLALVELPRATEETTGVASVARAAGEATSTAQAVAHGTAQDARAMPAVARGTAKEATATSLAMSRDAVDPLTIAREAMKEATTAWDARDFKRAEAALGRALDAYAAGAAQLTEASELADAYALRAAVRYATGRDAEAAASLTQALALAPNRPLPLAATSPLFAKTVERVRAAQESGPRGGVRFESIPSGLAVTLDGRPVGTAPLRVTDVPPGAHLWRSVLPSDDAVGGVVEVAPDKQAVVQVRPSGTGPDAALALALASNRLDTAALEAASALGRAAGADLVVLGTVARTVTGLAVDAFVLAPGDTTPRRLARLSVDTELLEASAPLREGIAAVAARGVEAGVTEPLPVVPAPGDAFAPPPSQVAYPVSTERAPEAPKPAAPAPDRKPLQPIRKPLVRP
jgi:tetratricopeptide (TPR) repeat protein